MAIDAKSKLFIVGVFVFGFITAIVLIYTFGNFVREEELTAFENELSLARVPDVERSSAKAQPADEMADWKTYRNEGLGFSIRYPNNIMPTFELNDQYNRLVAFGSSQKENLFEVRLQRGDIVDMGVLYGFLGAKIVSKDVKLSGVPGFLSVSETGYGDVGVQGRPYVVSAAKHDGNFYHVIFYGDTELDKTEQMILDSFKFIQR